MKHTSLTPMSSHGASALGGTIKVTGDKSISHRALILASQVLGQTKITGLLEGEDVINTANALRAMGVKIERIAANHWIVQGVGVGGLSEPSGALDMGNSGTGARLMMGLVAPYEFVSFFVGDASLSSRPMKRVITPLEKMGVKFVSHSGGKLPLALQGSNELLPIEYTLPVASAQIKSAILLAALNIAGTTTVIEPQATRDHTERMLKHFGWQIETNNNPDGSVVISLNGQQELPPEAREIIVPSDPSSAAFPVVAALIVPNSDITIENVTINPLRIGLYTTLKEMGANIEFQNPRISAGEEVADIRVRYSKLRGVTVPPERAPSMIDEYPILAIAASFAEGKTTMQGLAELKVKESDRLAAIAAGLTECGVSTIIEGDNLIVVGSEKPKGGGRVKTNFDHRIAMSFLIMGLATSEKVKVDDTTAIATSFPNFVELINKIGGKLAKEETRNILTIAIDGPAASGKGTLARRLAEHLGYNYLDTGSIYRAVGLKLVYSGKNPYDKRAACDAALSLTSQDLSNPRLRQEKIGQAASIISSIPEVRAILLDFQRSFAKNPKGAILDGRDIGTVVCPDADVKIFITASMEARADRRHRELQGEGIKVVYESVLEDLRERDERDAKRDAAPLIPADDAIIIDSSDMDADSVFLKVLEIVKGKIAGR